jgi:dolichol kinase
LLFFPDKLLAEAPYAVVIAAAVLVGLWISNIVYDLKVPHYLSRKIGHSAGGLGFLLSTLLFSSAWWPIILAALFGILLLTARLVRPQTFRGVGGSGRSEKVLAEVWFAWVAVPVFGISWLWLDRPFVAASCLLFMAWGDCVTGIVRSQVYHQAVKGLWGSLAMLCVCLIVSWAFITPFWIGAIGSLVAVATEWAFGDIGIFKWADDNWAIPVTSLGTILGIMALTGNL